MMFNFVYVGTLKMDMFCFKPVPKMILKPMDMFCFKPVPKMILKPFDILKLTFQICIMKKILLRIMMEKIAIRRNTLAAMMTFFFLWFGLR